MSENYYLVERNAWNNRSIFSVPKQYHIGKSSFKKWTFAVLHNPRDWHTLTTPHNREFWHKSYEGFGTTLEDSLTKVGYPYESDTISTALPTLDHSRKWFEFLDKYASSDDSVFVIVDEYGEVIKLDELKKWIIKYDPDAFLNDYCEIDEYGYIISDWVFS